MEQNKGKALAPGERFPLTQDERTLVVEMTRAKALHQGVMMLAQEIKFVTDRSDMPNKEKYVPGLRGSLVIAEHFSEHTASVAKEASNAFWQAVGKRLGIDVDAATYEVDVRTMDVGLSTPEGDKEAQEYAKRRAAERVMHHMNAKGSA